MEHLDLSSLLARERQARYRAQARRNRLARPARDDAPGHRRATTDPGTA